MAGRELYDMHASRVYSLAYRLSGDAEKAREFLLRYLAENTYEKALQTLAAMQAS